MNVNLPPPMLAAAVDAGAGLLALGAFPLCWHYWEELADEEEGKASRQFLTWAARSLGGPLLVWAVFNLGILPALPPFIPEIAFAQEAGGNWAPAYWKGIAPGVTVIATYWGAVTLVALLIWTSQAVENRHDFKTMCLFWGGCLLPVAAASFWATGWPGLGFSLLWCLVPMVHFTVPMTQGRVVLPSYARAVARIKFGKYEQAEQDVIVELEKKEQDYEGWMMLADLYANHFNELEEADRTIRALCTQPDLTAVQVSMALNRLADWHLKLGHDPVAARQALELISQRLPGSHVARLAQMRIAQLPPTRAALLERQRARPLRLPALSDALEEVSRPTASADSRQEAADQANQCVERLRQDPNDVASREKLALILADRLGKYAAAVDQLELLLGMPSPPPNQAAQWLGLAAAWRCKQHQDWAAARPYLERLVREFPQSPQAFAAQRRLCLLEQDTRAGAAPPPPKLRLRVAPDAPARDSAVQS